MAALLASVCACDSSQNSASNVPATGDASIDGATDSAPPTPSDSSAPDVGSNDGGSDDGGPADTGLADVATEAGLCTGHISGYTPPPFHPTVIEACTAANVDAYVAACGPSDFSPQCLAWKADPANATCKSCVLRTDGTGPLLYYNDGTFAQINEAACLAAGGAPDCGAKTNASYYCLFEACGSCPLDGGAVTGMCYEAASMGDCQSYGNAQDSCESTLTGPVVACEATMGTFETQLQKTITLLCGIAGDGGVPDDGGADGASEAGTGDAGANEAGAADAAHD